MKTQTPIGRRVALLSAVVILVVGFLASALVYYQVHDSSLAQKKEKLLFQVGQRVDQIEGVFLGAEDLVKVVSDSRTVREYLANPDPKKSEEVSVYLERFNIRGDFAAIYLMTATGSAVASTDRTFTGNNYGFRNYFQEGVRGELGRDMAIGVTSKEPGFYFSYPVKNDGKIIGVAVIKVKSSVLDRLAKSDEIGRLGQSLLVDSDGVILFSSRSDWLFRTLSPIDPARMEEIKRERKFEGLSLSPLAYEEVLRATVNYQQPIVLSVFDRLEGREEIISLAQVDNTGYFFILESGLSDISSQSIMLSLWVAGVVLLTVVSTALLTYLTSREYISEINKSYLETEKFKLAVESSENHIIITDPDAKIIFANKAVERITGYSQTEVIGNNPRLWGGLMGKEFYQKMWHQIKVERRPFHAEMKNRRKGGEEYYASMTISPIINDKKRLVGFVGLEVDITPRIRTEEKLREQTRTLAEEKAKDEAILASIGDGVVVVNSEGKILLLNKASQRLLGWKFEDVLGRTFRDTVFLKDALGNVITSDRPIDTALAGESISTSEYYLTRRDGSDFPAHITTSPVRFAGEVAGAIMTFHDISMEKAVDRAKSEFVSLASHQLRTPLSAVNWYAEMLLSGDLGAVDPNQKKYLEEIYESNKRMVELVNSLLNVSRIDLGTFAIEPESINVIDLVKSVVMELRPQIVFKKLLLVENYDPNVPVMQADPKLVRIVVQNLVTNAVKYTSSGGRVGLDIKLTGKGDKVGEMTVAKDSVLIKVSDNGYGIPEEAKEKIFTKLFRADNIKEKETVGTGLGLYTVKSIVEAAGGGIWFDSTINQGSTFYVLLPLPGMMKREGSKQLSYDVFGRIFS